VYDAGATPIFGYLLAGTALGSHGLDVFRNSKTDIKLGDFGILFFLFSEGLEVYTNRLRKLTDYLPLGFEQITLTADVLTNEILIGVPLLLKFVPLGKGLINVRNPIEALVLALVGTLSISVFIVIAAEVFGEEEEI